QNLSTHSCHTSSLAAFIHHFTFESLNLRQATTSCDWRQCSATVSSLLAGDCTAQTTTKLSVTATTLPDKAYPTNAGNNVKEGKRFLRSHKAAVSSEDVDIEETADEEERLSAQKIDDLMFGKTATQFRHWLGSGKSAADIWDKLKVDDYPARRLIYDLYVLGLYLWETEVDIARFITPPPIMMLLAGPQAVDEILLSAVAESLALVALQEATHGTQLLEDLGLRRLKLGKLGDC
ncbi:RXLR effector domain-containing protein, partial [Phytophthora infestans]